MSKRWVCEHVSGGPLKTKRSKMVADWSWVSPEASSREQTKIAKARGIREGFSTLHEVADQVREQIAIGHPSNRR